MNINDFPHEIKIGVAKAESGRIEALSWVMFHDTVIVGNLPYLLRYVPMSSKEEGLII